ncbi:N-acetyl-gamma-glutamyl-phosphate reductase [Lysobacter sp. TY2-98]|uniref:N-acetyl-gamma-glutamyl-phosphate reductase n=1 Tax=Lysobacter sp. TY2-98 TaxID=2290922 RepID=UPI000E1FEF52|nr:N-acetyl-gamma-glutamyl-phosphate reductase [Lysobacter sp. TY2-98]AXK72251.1 N-acetyl-gamma-glutamyl-phosphate reductase [Lysobacter sp. TY2-98]
MKRIPVSLIGARGHVGAELMRLIVDHPRFELVHAASRERAGQPVAEQVERASPSLRYSAPSPDELPILADGAYVLALPNGMAKPYVEAIERIAPHAVIVDLSADYRFDAAWHYGLPELADVAPHRRISNPGCYATAMQLAVAPMKGLLDGPVQCFGVSGYSGAGTTPSPRNDPEALRDNLMPYTLTGHVHEREVSRHLGHPVEFMPHVAPHFRGLTVTSNLHLKSPTSIDDVRARYRAFYANAPLVDVIDEPPHVRDVAGSASATVGGFALSEDGRRLVVVSILDNLLKGAATQAVQNLNLAFGLDGLAGLDASKELSA